MDVACPLGTQDPSINEAPRSVALVSPGWPVARFSNGIVSYTTILRNSMVGAGRRVHILAGWVEGIEDPAVRELQVLGTDPQPVRRLLGQARRRIGGHQAVWKLRGQAILREVRWLYRDVGLGIVQIPDTFGLPRYVAGRSVVPVVVRLHGPWFLSGRANGAVEDPLFAQRVRCEGLGIGAADGVMAPSHDVIDRVRSFYDMALPNASVIPNPIEPVAEADSWSLGNADGRRILFIGRFDRCKGGDVMIEAFAMLLKQGQDLRLTFVGQDRGLVDSAGTRWNLETFLADRLDPAARWRVEVIGRRPYDQLGELRRKAIVTVVPSRYETFGNVAIEAMVQGCPVVVSATGGLKEIVTDEGNGLLFSCGDASHLAHKILRLLRNHGFAARLGRQAAIDTKRRFHPDVIARRTLEFYGSVIEQHRAETHRHRRRRR